MKTEQLIDLMLRNGKPYLTGWYDEGNGESGPSGGPIYGFRLGELHMTVAPRNGSYVCKDEPVMIESVKHCTETPWGPGYPVVHAWIQNMPYLGMLIQQRVSHEVES